MDLKLIPVVKDFPYVFPNDHPNLPLDREIEFFIDVIPRMSSISKAPYRMAQPELEELKK